jgi:uracil phosphoribosyltransferase
MKQALNGEALAGPPRFKRNSLAVEWSLPRLPPMEVTVVDHPVVQDRLARLRHRDTPPESFRRAVHELGMLMAFEATRSLEVRTEMVPTPVALATSQVLARPVVVVPILRAGLGMLQGILSLLPEALIGHIGMARNEKTKRPESYFLKLPPGIADADVLLVDPMLATGHSGAAAATKLKEAGATRIAFVSILATPEGIAVFQAAHPDIPVFTASIDDGLTTNAFITPGLGDAGDRYFGTL